MLAIIDLDNLPKAILRLKKNINSKKVDLFRSLQLDENIYPEWLDALALYHSPKYSESTQLCDFYEKLGIEWRIEYFNGFLENLFTEEHSFVLYCLNKIINLAQGNTIDDMEKILLINHEKRKNLFIAPLSTVSNQKSILTVLYFDILCDNPEKWPRLGVIGWFNDDNYRDDIENFEKSIGKRIEIESVYKKNFFKSLLIITDKIKVLPKKQLIKDKTRIIFMSNSSYLKKNTEILIKDNLSQEILKKKVDEHPSKDQRIFMCDFEITKEIGYRLSIRNGTSESVICDKAQRFSGFKNLSTQNFDAVN